MFKRMLTRLWPKGKSGKNLATEPSGVNKLDPEGVFAITLPLYFEVETSPLETFTERAIVAYRKAATAHLRTVRGSIFQPQPNGTLTIYPPRKGENNPKKVN